MTKKFHFILIAQFFSALADNALLFAAIAMLASIAAPLWHTPLLQQFFIISYILLAPFVGPIADAFPKGSVMFFANLVKVLGCLAMILGMHPLFAYGIVGIGAAAYSPAKYGIMTELLPSDQLVEANGWMEGSTVIAIILGAILGGFASESLDVAMWLIAGLYVAAAMFNHFIPKLPADHKLAQKSLKYILKDFTHAFFALWRDPLGQVSLAVTTLFWGTGATLKFVVISWAIITLDFTFKESSYLIATVGAGIAIGAFLASKYITLEKSVKVLPAGIVMGGLVIAIIFTTHWMMAGFILLLIGTLSGFFVVPLNALLQHRGHHLVGSGHSIAVQNFNEHIGILIMLGIYLLMVRIDIHINTITIVFGTVIIISMSTINHIYRNIRVPE
ncbi:MAG: lysophospholipid transporter LplT [Methylophilaceae bacterium]|nr:lysophospholipid transporter LplT [Methylophilaceae bacterium]